METPENWCSLQKNTLSFWSSWAFVAHRNTSLLSSELLFLISCRSVLHFCWAQLWVFVYLKNAPWIFNSREFFGLLEGIRAVAASLAAKPFGGWFHGHAMLALSKLSEGCFGVQPGLHEIILQHLKRKILHFANWWNKPLFFHKQTWKIFGTNNSKPKRETLNEFDLQNQHISEKIFTQKTSVFQSFDRKSPVKKQNSHIPSVSWRFPVSPNASQGFNPSKRAETESRNPRIAKKETSPFANREMPWRTQVRYWGVAQQIPHVLLELCCWLT